MPGKHAPASPRSFYVSIAKLVAAVVGAALVVGLIAASALKSTAPSPSAARTPTASSTPTVKTSPSTPVVPVSPTPSEKALRKRGSITVLVLNATSRSGLAGRTADGLKAEGYSKITSGNDTDTKTSIVYYRAGYSAEAKRLANELGIATVKKAPSDLQGSAKLTVLLGSDFKE